MHSCATGGDDRVKGAFAARRHGGLAIQQFVFEDTAEPKCPPPGKFSSGLFSAHLLPDDPGHYASAFGLQQGLGVDPREQIQEWGNQSGPSRLMAGPKARAIVTVEILVKQDQVAPVWVVLELGRPAVDG